MNCTNGQKTYSRYIWIWKIISGSNRSLSLCVCVCVRVCTSVCMGFAWIMCLYIRPTMTWCVCNMYLCQTSLQGCNTCLLLKISCKHDFAVLLTTIPSRELGKVWGQMSLFPLVGSHDDNIYLMATWRGKQWFTCLLTTYFHKNCPCLLEFKQLKIMLPR